MLLVEWLAQPAGRVLTLTLLHFVWQAFAVGASLALLVWLCGISRPATRYACSLAALMAMTTFPIATLSWILLMNDTAPFARPLGSEFSFDLSSNLADSNDSLFVIVRGWFESAQPYALAAWLSGVLFFGSRLVAGAIGIAQLRRGRLPIPAELAARVERLGTHLQMNALPLVFLSKQVTDAVALGLVRRFVLIPAAWATEMSLEMLEAVIAHELAHLRRMDLWTVFLQRIVETLFFYHPAVWWLSRRLVIERELCSDELAVMATGERLIYAQTLEHIAGGRQADIRPALAAYLQGESNMRLLERVRNVLAPSSVQCRHWPAGLLALGLAVGLWTLSLSILNPLTPAAHADEPAQEEAANDEPSDAEENGQATSDEESIEIEFDLENDVEGEEATNEEAIDVDVDLELDTVIEKAINEELPKELIESDLQEVIKAKVAAALKQALLEVEEAKSNKGQNKPVKVEAKLDKAKPDREQMLAKRKEAVAQQKEVVNKVRLSRGRLLADRKKALQQDAEKLKRALITGEPAEAEALKKALADHAEELHKTAREQNQFAADEMKKAMLEHSKAMQAGRQVGQQSEQLKERALKDLHQHMEEFGKARRGDEQHHAEALKALHQHMEQLGKARKEDGQNQAEVIKELHRHMEVLANAKLQGFLKQQPTEKASPERANDERIAELAAMVKELAGQVDHLRDELKAMRGDKQDDSPLKEGKL